MCGWFEVFQECGKLECEKSCDDVKNLRNRERCRRSTTCKSGCYCKPGTFRNNKGKCVSHQECGIYFFYIYILYVCLSFNTSIFVLGLISKCNDPHEVFSSCGNNSCQNICQARKSNKANCAGPCIPGCICENNFYRNDKGKCVPFENCGKH